MQVAEKVQNNVRDRITAVNLIAEGVEKDISAFMDSLKRLEPVQAIAEFGKYKGKGVLDFVEKQAEITRRWLK